MKRVIEIYIRNVSHRATFTYGMFLIAQLSHTECFSSSNFHIRNVSHRPTLIYGIFLIVQLSHTECFSSCNFHIRNVSHRPTFTYRMFLIVQLSHTECFSSCNFGYSTVSGFVAVLNNDYLAMIFPKRNRISRTKTITEFSHFSSSVSMTMSVLSYRFGDNYQRNL